MPKFNIRKRQVIPFIIMVFLIVFLVFYYNYKPRLSYTYSKEYNGYLVTKAYGNSKSYKIPNKHRGKNVVGISTRAFYDHDNLEKIVFESPENIKYIGRLSFSKCDSLKSINLTFVELIDKNAFSYDKKLNNITTSATIAGSAFFKCTSLDSVTLNEGVDSIGTYAFSYTKISTITLPKSVSNVYVDSFKYTFDLVSIKGYYTLKSEYLDTIPCYQTYE